MSSIHHYIIKPLVDMREENTHSSKVVSQALFSEKITVCKEEGGWSYITSSDGYSGWVPSDAYVARQAPYAHNCTVSRLSAHLYRFNDIEYGPVATLPYGTALHASDDSDPRWVKVVVPNGQDHYMQKGDLRYGQLSYKNKNELPAFSRHFLGLPYTWGGRSSFGYDCSGFVQMLYSHLGVQLPRDSNQQILDPRFKTCAIEQIEPGDLLFYGKSEHRIMHVALALCHGQFIHASVRENQPWIRISSLDDLEWSGKSAAHYPYRVARQLINVSQET